MESEIPVINNQRLEEDKGSESLDSRASDQD
jgi:hypothetical protein